MLKLQQIKKTYQNCFEPVLKSVNLTINEGDFCILLGGNGSGKSTLLNIIAGNYDYDSGLMEHKFGSNVKNFASIVTQDVTQGTVAELSILENILLAKMKNKAPSLKFYKDDNNFIFNEIKKLNIGLEEFLDKPISLLSGGQKQMIATLMAIISEPRLLLLDEHTSALDPVSAKMLMDYSIQEVERKKITCIMITHKLEEAINYGNRIIMLKNGHICLDLNKKDSENFLTKEWLFEQYHKDSEEL